MMIDTEKLENLNATDFAHVDAMVRSETKARARVAAALGQQQAMRSQYQAAQSMQQVVADQNGVILTK